MSTTITEITTFVIQTCCYSGCGIRFGMEKRFDEQRREDHEWWYCPNGHKQHYDGQSEAEKAQAALALAERRLERERAATQAARDQADAAHRQAVAYKGHATRLRKRVAAGCCPACNRTFQDLQRHMGSKHPGYGET